MVLCNFRLFGYAHEHVYNLIRLYFYILLLTIKNSFCGLEVASETETVYQNKKSG